MISYNGKFAPELSASVKLLQQSFPALADMEIVLTDGAPDQLRTVNADGKWQITAGSHAAFLRGIGHALSGCAVEENSTFETLGIMLDCSRNKVHRISFIKDYLSKLALMGYNFAMLYTEDTYLLDSEPYFGYMRGAYTLDEIRELDDHAAALGIELTACIQTLGHLGQILQYGEYTKCRDTAHVMMPDESATYELVEKMLAFWKKALRSQRIHIGMDETRDLGRGRYLDINRNYVDGYTLFSRHLTKMDELCRKHGLRAIIWSDMFFRLGNAEWVYYDKETVVPEEVKAAIPPDVQLCYWDYYHDNAEFYEDYIAKHRDLGSEPMLGSGVWTWGRVWYDHPKTVATALPAIAAGRKTGLKELFFTMWGDNGGYCLYESALAGLEMCAGAAYGTAADNVAFFAERCCHICGFDYRLYIAAAEIYPGDDRLVVPEFVYWDDPLLGMYITALRNKSTENFDRFSDALRKSIDAVSGTADDALILLQTFFKCVSAKIALFESLNQAYAAADRGALREIADRNIPDLIALCRQYDQLFRRNWLKNAKPFGLEVMQRRSAGMVSRLQETQQRIGEYLDGTISAIDEIDARLASKVTEGRLFSASIIQ